MKRYIFIINRNAGTKQNITKEKILKYLPSDIEPIIFFTSSKEEAIEILKRYDNEMYFVAGGGDGTVNLIASHIINTEKKLFILPLGSGNATARHLNIPIGIKSLRRLSTATPSKTDIISFQGRKALSLSGIGLDGEIAHKFQHLKMRGLKSYIVTTLKAYFNYKPFEATITSENGQTTFKNILLISIANMNQFGNNAFIAPNANPYDGLMNICILRRVHIYNLLKLTFYLFTKRIDHYKHYTEHICKAVHIKTLIERDSHFDGEPLDKKSNSFDAQIKDFIYLLS